MKSIMAVMARRTIFVRLLLVWVLVLIFYYGTSLFAGLLHQRLQKAFAQNRNNDNTIISYPNNIKISQKEIMQERIKINLIGSPPPYECLPEVFPNKGSFRIETIIHQTWIDKNIPEDFRKYVSSLKEHHSNFVYMFWTDKMALKFVEAMFPMILPFYVNYRHNLQRADAVRYMILYEYGGVYADLDIVSLRPLDPILRKYSCILSQEPHIHPIFYNNFYGLACNAFMACRSHHPFMKILVDNLPSFSVAAGVLDSTGPRFVTIVYRNYIVDHPQVNKTDADGVLLAPPEYFMPSSDPTLQGELENLCSKNTLTDLYKWLCERFKNMAWEVPQIMHLPTTSGFIQTCLQYQIQEYKRLVLLRLYPM
ncbi:hypothetical protein CHS0354_012599 [Potamilus streckersoni]|uniref:Uncharacterized protein n=1 Tax=Potamilus streckersoni TaxID=2493646 RepID=A0AAE0W2S2_9BIVA|nr:hypothetical protein CHS0354_012599 [Potamilus streckersoni]